MALLVFALVAGALQLCLAGGWKSVRLARMDEAALQVAKAQLATAGVESPLAEGAEEGATAEGFTWRRDIRRHVAAEESGATPAPIAGYWVTVSVSWADGPRRTGKSIELRTLKIGRGG